MSDFTQKREILKKWGPEGFRFLTSWLGQDMNVLCNSVQSSRYPKDCQCPCESLTLAPNPTSTTPNTASSPGYIAIGAFAVSIEAIIVPHAIVPLCKRWPEWKTGEKNENTRGSGHGSDEGANQGTRDQAEKTATESIVLTIDKANEALDAQKEALEDREEEAQKEWEEEKKEEEAKKIKQGIEGVKDMMSEVRVLMDEKAKKMENDVRRCEKALGKRETRVEERGLWNKLKGGDFQIAVL